MCIFFMTSIFSTYKASYIFLLMCKFIFVLWIGKMSTEFDFRTIISSQTSIMGDLRQLLSQGEYAPFTSSPMFESKFVQVKKTFK